jgi:hypothetical protein
MMARLAVDRTDGALAGRWLDRTALQCTEVTQ